MIKNKIFVFHLFFAILNTIALIAAFIYALDSKTLEIYFSYFTVLSNIFITLLFYYLAFSKRPLKKLISNLYGASVLYMTITGIVFWTLLRNDHAISPTEWITFVLHGVMPIATLLSWLFYSPKFKFDSFDPIKWLIFPIGFVVYTLIRGPIANWYPYPFLNPEKIGYTGVFEYVLGILIGSFIISQILIRLSNSRIKS